MGRILVRFNNRFAFALLFKRQIAKPKKFEWEEDGYDEDNDPFLKHFDEDGNFIEKVEPEMDDNQPEIKYNYKENKD